MYLGCIGVCTIGFISLLLGSLVGNITLNISSISSNNEMIFMLIIILVIGFFKSLHLIYNSILYITENMVSKAEYMIENIEEDQQ